VSTYFAYASNMSAPVMSAACPRHRFLGRARLPGWRLAFTRRSVRTGTGVADLLADPDGVVWGVLYEISDTDLESLDQKEGRGWAYERRGVRVFADDGSLHDAVAYVVITKSSEPIAPSDRYAQRLLAAARERGLPEDYVRALAEADARASLR
jgi:gamma-glutamylcyclotransferase